MAFLRKYLSLAIAAFKNYVAPETCPGCGAEETALCGACREKTKVESVRRKAAMALDVAYLLPIDDPLAKELVHEGKYGRRPWRFAELVADSAPAVRAWAAALSEENEGKTMLFVPVPLHKSRKRERGYNQSEIIANSLAALVPGSEVADLGIRVKKTKQQALFENAAEREANVEKAFSLGQPLPADSLLVLVDDVCTTGSTLAALAAAFPAGRATECFTICG